MSCTSPVRAWRRPSDLAPGSLPFDPHTGEVLEHPRRLSFSPVSGYESLQVGCGRCDGCRADRSMEWSIRAYHESTLHERNSFLTLSYADAPPRLVKKDLQDFFKRARHFWKFRYLACGEYGDSTNRPHYHALVFGEDFLDGKIDISDMLYTSQRLASCWGHGLVSVGELNMATCCYVAGYVFKKVGDKETFSLQSRRPGIGHDWLNAYGDNLRRNGFVTIEGREYPVPRRYLNWQPVELQNVKRDRAERFAGMSYEQQRIKEDQLPAKKLKYKSQLSMRSKKL